MSRIFSSVGISLAALALSGCSGGARITVTSRGAMPSGGTYAIAEGAPAEIDESIAEALTRRGLTRSETPSYIIQIGYAERSAGIGLLVPHDPDSQWLRQPSPHHKKRAISTLDVSIAEASNGRERYRASATGRPPSKGSAWASLLRSILDAPLHRAAGTRSCLNRKGQGDGEGGPSANRAVAPYRATVPRHHCLNEG